ARRPRSGTTPKCEIAAWSLQRPRIQARTARSTRPKTLVNILIATSNPGKVREFREMLSGGRFAWSDLSAHPDVAPVEETGRTFRANACLKAVYYATRLNTWSLADDSGLEVDALDRKP